MIASKIDEVCGDLSNYLANYHGKYEMEARMADLMLCCIMFPVFVGVAMVEGAFLLAGQKGQIYDRIGKN
jgi:hypothetical protein